MWVKNRISSALYAFSWALLCSGECSWVCFLSSSALTATWFWVSRSPTPCLCVRCCQTEPTRQSLGDLWVRSVAGMLWFGVYQTWVGGSRGKWALLWVPGHFSSRWRACSCSFYTFFLRLQQRVVIPVVNNRVIAATPAQNLWSKKKNK